MASSAPPPAGDPAAPPLAAEADSTVGTDPAAAPSIKAGAKAGKKRLRTDSIVTLDTVEETDYTDYSEDESGSEDEEEEEYTGVLSEPIPVLEGMLDDVPRTYKHIPVGLGWRNAASVKNAFKVIPGCGTLPAPQSLLDDGKTAADKLLIINMWRNLTKAQQEALIVKLKKKYKAYTKNNDKRTTAASASRKRRRQADIESLPKCSQLSTPIRFFTVHNVDFTSVPMHYQSVKDGTNWESAKDLNTTYPPVLPASKYGTRHIVICVIMEAKTPLDKLIVLNWWRNLSQKEQQEWMAKLRAVYAAPTARMDLLPTAYQTGPTHVGLADTQEMIDEAISGTASARNAQTSKGKKRTSIKDKAQSTTQMVDEPVRTLEIGLQKKTLRMGNATTLKDGCSGKGFSHTMTLTVTNLNTPPESGFLASAEAIRDGGRPKMTITCYGGEAQVNTILDSEFVSEQRKTKDVVIVDKTTEKMPNEVLAKERAKPKKQKPKENSKRLQKKYAGSSNVRHNTVQSLPG